MNNVEIKDHTGKKFESVPKMCQYYNITLELYLKRMMLGWSLEKVLTEPYFKLSKEYKDHLGNKYKSITEMCEKYEVNQTTFRRRLMLGYDLKYALTEITINKKQNIQKDHIGNEFNSINEMCKNYGISKGAYTARIRKGWSLEKALIYPLNKNSLVKDHLGNTYRNEFEMCKSYNIKKATYRLRIKKGWSLEKALTNQLKHTNKRIKCKDHLGNSFNSVYSMCSVYKIKRCTFDARIRNGKSLKEALTLDVKKTKTGKRIKMEGI